jgi:hypothetical protein
VFSGILAPMNRRLFLRTSATFLSLPLWAQTLVEFAGAQAPGQQLTAGTFFLGSDKTLLLNLIDLILPKSSEPGALDAGVPNFLDRLLTASEVKTQSEFRAGLLAFQKWIRTVSGRDFEALSSSEQLSYVNSLFHPTAVPVVSDWMKTLKLLTLYGYRNWSVFFNQKGLTTRYLGPEELP